MCTNEKDVSAYLRRPLRSYAKAIRERAERIRRRYRVNTSRKAATDDPARPDADDAEPGR